MFAETFSNLATSFAEQFGAPFIDATVNWPGEATFDAGGAVLSPGSPVSKACKVQFDAPTEAMRADAGFVSTDARLIVLAGSLDGVLDEKARIVVSSGQYAGTWALLSCVRDPAGIGYECRGRRVS